MIFLLEKYFKKCIALRTFFETGGYMHYKKMTIVIKLSRKYFSRTSMFILSSCEENLADPSSGMELFQLTL
jgi:hypothetical protein